MVTQTNVFFCNTQVQNELFAVIFPIIEPVKVCIRFAEEFQLHLFKFTSTENKVAGVISLRKDFPICATPNGSLRRVVR